MQINFNLDIQEISQWFNTIRNLPEAEKNLALEAFWSGQLESKAWLVNTLNNHVSTESNIYIFGGWIGVLASMLFQRSKFSIKKIRSIDIDPWCESIADNICKRYEMNEWQFKARTSNMAHYDYEWNIDPHIVINTSTEHINQETYDRWFNKIPDNTMIVIQGNNYFDHAQHIRCSKNISEFILQNYVVDPIVVDSFKTELYTRFMCIWIK